MIGTIDPNNKEACIKYGVKREQEFVKFAASIGIKGFKWRGVKFEPDLEKTGVIAELKNQETPFFMAQRFYGVDSQYCVSFNRYDYERYALDYPGLPIYFLVNWRSLELKVGQQTHKVEPLHGIWLMTAEKMHLLISKAKEHTYTERGGNNKKSSFGLDLREMESIWTEKKWERVPEAPKKQPNLFGGDTWSFNR